MKVYSDSFHIIINVNDAIDEVRREACRNMDRQQKQVIKSKRYQSTAP